MKSLKCLWRDQQGFVASTELILLTVVLAIGVMVGLVTFRDQVVQEFGDMATAIGRLNQSYSYSGDTGDAGEVAGSSYEDLSDFGEEEDTAGQEPAGISVSGAGSQDEGTAASPGP